jgi:hypothetical protein
MALPFPVESPLLLALLAVLGFGVLWASLSSLVAVMSG